MSRWLDSGSGEISLPKNITLRTGMETRVVGAVAPNVIVLDDRRYESEAQQGSWFSNFKYGQMFPAHLARLFPCYCSTSLLPLAVRHK